MKVAYSSLKNFQQLKPDSNTVVLSLLGDSSDIVEAENTGWKKHLSIKFNTLSPTGPEGSFKDMDDQAKNLARKLKPHLEGVEKIIVHCQYGEIRSAAVATGIYFSARFGPGWELYEIDSKGNWSEADIPHMDTFGGRTYSNIASILEGRDNG